MSRIRSKELDEHRAELLKAGLDAVNVRLADRNDRIADVNFMLTAFAILITLIGILIGAIAFVSAGQKARDSARDWMNSHTVELLAEITKLREQAAEVKRAMDETQSHNANVEKRFSQQTQSPGTESAVRRSIQELQHG